uniref:Uncharacterized protein n=1 Tax=Acrobeloides nanus TaxID=290746 RepID=A0A914C872_9BILA
MMNLLIMKMIFLASLCNFPHVLAHPGIHSTYPSFQIYAANLVRHRRSQECLIRHENNLQFQSVLKSIAIKNPTNNHHVEQIEEPLPTKSVPSMECQTEQLSSISPDMPLMDRSLCGFRFIENFDDKRIPKAITEVECLCNQPRNVQGSTRLLCEPLYYNIPVLKFDEACSMFKEEVERISLACLPVFASQTTANNNLIFGQSSKTEIDV